MLLMKHGKKWLVGLLCLWQLTSFSQYNIVPMPAEITKVEQVAYFKLHKRTVIYYNDKQLKKDVAYLQQQMKSKWGLAFEAVYQPTNGRKPSDKSAIYVNLSPSGSLSNHSDEYYALEAVGNTINITVQHPKGFFYSVQTLLQLIEEDHAIKKSYVVKAANFKDYPRFAYRGMHLDVARHFFSVDYVKRYIDYLAFHKFNTFHWHLTDDQGWRIEIQKYPRLTSVGAWRNGTIIGRYPGKGNDNKPDGGFYTQKQIREIVQYAADRYITVIPEIELPGHASAAIAAYPQLSCFPDEKTDIPANMISKKSDAAEGKLVQETWGVFEDVFCPSDYTFTFLQNVLAEVMDLFPSKYIHIGGDECPKEAWKRSEFCQQLIKEKGLKDEHGLQSWFIQQIESFVNKNGRQIIGWDEILEGGLAPNATVMSWRGEEGGIAAAKQHHNVIMTPGSHCYFDHSQTKNEDSVTIGSYLPLEKVYNYEPVPKELTEAEAVYILGAQANLWTEYITNPAKVEYMIFPRMSALSEVLWSPKAKRNWNSFEQRLPRLLQWYNSWGANFSNAYYDIDATVIPGDNGTVAWQLKTKNESARLMVALAGKDGKWENLPYKGPVVIKADATVKAAAEVAGRQEGDIVQQTFYFNKATGKKITLANQPSKNYPGDGAFTLVNGVQNNKGMNKAEEFLGFPGSNCEALIDLGTATKVSKVTVHAFRQPSSWIWEPASVHVLVSTDGIQFSALNLASDFVVQSGGNGTITVPFEAVTARYIKLEIQNWGDIPAGNPGAGSKAWLFLDEIEVW